MVRFVVGLGGGGDGCWMRGLGKGGRGGEEREVEVCGVLRMGAMALCCVSRFVCVWCSWEVLLEKSTLLITILGDLSVVLTIPGAGKPY